MKEPSLSIEGYARVRAEMEAGWLRDGVLSRAGVSLSEWTNLQLAFLEKMGNEVERGRFDLTNRYSQAFLERQREIAAPAPTSREMVSASATPETLPTPSLGPTVAPTPFAITPPSVTPAATAPAAMASYQKAPPAAQPAPTAHLEAPAAPPVGVAETQDFDLRKIIAALPFSASNKPPPAPPRPSAPPSAKVEPTPTPPKEAPSPASAQALTGAASLGETTGLPTDIVSRIQKGQLPFARSQPPVSSQKPPTPPVTQSVSSVPAPQPPKAPETASPTSALSLEQYAALCAELAASPMQTDSVFARYNLKTQRERLDVDLAWRERLRRNPAEYQSWQGLYQRYLTYWQDLARRGGQG